MSDKIKIAIADDHQLVLDGLKSMLEQVKEFEVVAMANDGMELIKLLELVKADVVLTDMDMPNMNGLEVIKRLRQDDHKAKILVLTMHNEKALVQKVMSAGANGYLLKNSDREEFMDAIEKVMDGQTYFSSEVTMALLNTDKVDSTEIGVVSVAQMTDREIEILKLVAEGMNNKEVGDKLFISHRTVDTHRTNLMKKLDVHNVAGLIRFAIKNGLA